MSTPRLLAAIIGLTTAYVAAGQFGLSLAFVNPSATAVWPPSGIALAALLILGRRAWPGVFAGAFIVNQLTAGTVWTSLLIASGNTLEAVLGAALMDRFANGGRAFSHDKPLLTFAAIAALVSALGATTGVATLALFGLVPWSHYATTWVTWWLGDTTGILVVAPALLLWHSDPHVAWSRRQAIEAVALLACVLATGGLVFIVSPYPVAFVCVPVCVWAAFRFGSREAATVSCLLSLLAVWGSARGLGGFGGHPPGESLLLATSFMGVATLVSLSVGTAVAQRRSAAAALQRSFEQLDVRVRARTRELEAALERLQASEARFLEAQRVANVGSWEWRVRDNRQFWSDQLYRIFGLDPGSFEPSFEGFLDRLHPEDRETVEAVFRTAFADHQPFECENRIIRSDGTARVLYVRGRVALDAAGQVARFMGVAQDITERKRLEEQLRGSQKLEAVGLLAGGIAHDFNNLLTAIGGYTEMVLGTFPSGDPRQEELQEVAQAVQRGSALTRQLLAVSRRQILRPRVLDMNAVVEGVHKLLHRTIPEHIEIQLALQRDLDAVCADPGQLEQVLLNLGINAGDAMPHGGLLRVATATIALDPAAAERRAPMPAGRYVRLAVSDTGSGIAPEVQARIFEPFFTTKDRGRGTGMGLATVYGIVKQSNGFIFVDSAVGQGTTFEVYLPAVQQPIEAARAPESALQYRGGSQTILLAEDDSTVRALAREVLSRNGYTVLDAQDGEEALTLARGASGQIDLLVTDVVMPGISGRDLAARLTVERPEIRVLYTSGYTENVMKRAGLDAASLRFLPKPFLPADLLRKVGETLAVSS